MRKTILTIASAGAIALAGATAAPKPAHALAEWVIPAIIGAGALGIGTGAAVNESSHHCAYEPRGTVYVQPTANCRVSREYYRGRWHSVRVCD